MLWSVFAVLHLSGKEVFRLHAVDMGKLFAVISTHGGPGGQYVHASSTTWSAGGNYNLHILNQNGISCLLAWLKISFFRKSKSPWVDRVSLYAIFYIFCQLRGAQRVAKIGIFQKKKSSSSFLHPKRKPDPPREVNFSPKKFEPRYCLFFQRKQN